MNSKLLINYVETVADSLGIQSIIFAFFILLVFLLHNICRLIAYYYPRKRNIPKITADIFGNALALHVVSTTYTLSCIAILLISYLILIAFGL